MKGLSVKQWIAGSFLLVIGVMLATSVLYHQRASADEDRIHEVQTYDLTGVTGSSELGSLLDAHLKHTYQAMLEAQAAPRVEFKRSLLQRFAALDAEIDRSHKRYLPTMVSDSDRSSEASFSAALKVYREQHRELLILLEHASLAEADAYMIASVEPAWARCDAAVQLMQRVNEGQIAESLGALDANARRNKRTSLVALALAVGIASVCGLFLYRSLARPLDHTLAAIRLVGDGDLSKRLRMNRDDEFDAIERGFNNMVGSLRSLVSQAQTSAERLGASISEIAAMAGQQQATVTETAAATRQIGVTSDEITRSSHDLARTMGDVSRRAEQTAELANAGQLGVRRIAEVMRQLAGAAGGVSDKLLHLRERVAGLAPMVAEVGKRVESAERVSRRSAGSDSSPGQAVRSEASRDAGRSTAGVAEIDRRIRDVQLTVADTVAGLNRFVDDVQRGQTEMLDVGTTLQQVILQIQALAPRVQSVGDAMRAQAVGAEQINQALRQLSTTSRQTALALTHVYGAIQDVDGVARDLRVGVARFSV